MIRHIITINKQGYCQRFNSLHYNVFYFSNRLVGIWREICWIALWHKRGRGLSAFRVSGDGRWRKEWQAEWRVTSNMFIFFREREQKVMELMRGKNDLYSSAGAELWQLLDNKHFTDSSDLSPLFVIPELISCRSVCQTAGLDFISDIRCHRWFSLCLTSCQSHYCPLWERHTRTDLHTGRMRHNRHQDRNTQKLMLKKWDEI